ncbi:XP_029656816.1uncharacterized protein LOC115230831 isoform X2 [Octopus vulgaris]|uniref:XP_029656816.1uncharacterized protein LOC115230831 isoform X2 n=1 Tax=Octopus vulgaris TaxID=6645 RepID=A0AA36BTK2_OCTVU|nr:XP_029656816.1uncharacterized protein LOC115230831 isoform X2 [Octopus vulgaris]
MQSSSESKMLPELFREHHKKMIDDLRKAITSYITIIQIYGLCFVGKTELIKQVLKVVKTETSREVQYFCCKTNYVDCQNLGKLKRGNIIVFDHFDTLLPTKRSEELEFMRNSSITFPETTFILVFRGLEPLLTNELCTKEFQVLPLGKSKARELFDCEFSSNLPSSCEGLVNTLLDWCCGFPLMILKLAKTLSLFPNEKGVEDCFEKFEIPDRYFKYIKGMLKRRSQPVKKLLAILSHSDVQFSYDYLQRAAERANCSKNSLENPSHVIKKSGLLIENEDQTYSLQPVIRQAYSQLWPDNQSTGQPVNQSLVNQSFYSVRSSCLARLNFNQMTGEIFLTAASYFQDNKFQQVHNILADHKHTILTLFGKVLHGPDGDCLYFQNLYALCEKAGKIISLHPNRAVSFYQCCYDMSCLFGSKGEQAFLQYKIGQSLIKHSVDRNLSKGEEFCKKALGTLQTLKDNFKIINVYTTLAMISYWKGSWNDARRYCEAAIGIEIDDRSAKEEKFAKTFCRSILAYNYMCQGLIAKGIAIADELVVDPVCQSHPTFGIIISTLAWSYYLKGIKDFALDLYKKSLAVLKENNLEKNRWVVPMCYIADLESDLKREHRRSLKKIYDAEMYQKESCIKHVNFHRINLVKAKIHLRIGNLLVAMNTLVDAENDMTKSGSLHYILVDIQIWLAHCYLINGQTDLATKKFEESYKSLEQLKHPCDNSCKTIARNHLTNPSNCLDVADCDICLNLKEHNRQVKLLEEEEHLGNGMRCLSASESSNECRFPQCESGRH